MRGVPQRPMTILYTNKTITQNEKDTGNKIFKRVKGHRVVNVFHKHGEWS